MVSLCTRVALGAYLDLNRNLTLNPDPQLCRLRSRTRAGPGLGIALFIGLLNLPWSASRAADTNAVLDAWLATQTNLHTWTADLTQTRTLKTLTQPLTATGHLWFGTPNRFRWELGSPARTIAVRNADEMFVIYPRLKRAE